MYYTIRWNDKLSNKYYKVGAGSVITYLRRKPVYSIIEPEIAQSFDINPYQEEFVDQVFEYHVGSIDHYIRMSVRYTHHNRVDLDLYPIQPKWSIHR